MKLCLIEEELTEICNDHTLRLKHSETSLESFCIPLKGGRACEDLMQSSTSYLCKWGFYAFVNIKIKKEGNEWSQSRMKCDYILSKICPIIKEICKCHQSHPLH